jgi:hypothetical protein
MRKKFLDNILKLNIILIAILTLTILVLLKDFNYWFNYLAVCALVIGYFLLKQRQFKIVFLILMLVYSIIIVFFIQTSRPVLFEYSILYTLHLLFTFQLIIILTFLIYHQLVQNVNEKTFYFSFIILVIGIFIFSIKPYKRITDKRSYIKSRIEKVKKEGIELPNNTVVEFSKCLYESFSELYGYSNKFPDSTKYTLTDHEILFDCSFKFLIENPVDLDYEMEKKAYLEDLETLRN